MIGVSEEFKAGGPPQFKIDTLGRFDVVKDGRSLVMSSPGAKKIWELYKFMLTHRERSFTPEGLMDQLWVAEEYNDLRSTLRRQMHRLKQTLDEEDCGDCGRTLMFSNGYYRWNSSLSMQLDADAFEGLVKQGDSLRETAPQNALELYQQALELYKGDYLPECAEQHWVFPIRNHLRRLYLNTVINAIELLKETGSHDAILSLCQKAIQIDIYEEAFHLSLMDALRACGDIKQALEHYEYITGFYYREMGIKPSLEMRTLYKTLLKEPAEAVSGIDLNEALEADVILENAFYCEFEVFKSIYELERRRCQRSGASFSIGLLTSVPRKDFTSSQRELQMNCIKSQLTEQLRMGDTFTRWNDNQFVVLLPGVDAALTEKVLKRVLKGNCENATVEISQITHLTAEIQQALTDIRTI